MKGIAVIISNKYPFPTDDGKKTVLAGFLAYLIDRFGRDNVLYVVIGRRNNAAQGEVICRNVWIDPPTLSAQAWNVFRCISRLDRKSMQEALTYSSKVERKLKDLLSSVQPQLIILDTLRIGQFFWSWRPLGSRLVLYMDDLFSLRFRRMTEVTKTTSEVRFDPSGTFSSTLPAIARAVIKIGVVHKYLFKLESARTEAREHECTALFDQCLLINPNEAKTLLDNCPGKPIASVTPVLFNEPCGIRRMFDGSPMFLLFGSLRHPVYRASVMRFLAHDMDGVLQSIPNARICMVGDGADDEIRSLCARFDGRVEALGFVDRLDEIFSTACALLVPLLAAGGLKLKVLTALYYGLPIISTDSGVDGIPLIDGTHFLRESATERFSIHMRRLMDVKYNLEISRNASAIFNEVYSKTRIYQDYDNLMDIECDAGIAATH